MTLFSNDFGVGIYCSFFQFAFAQDKLLLTIEQQIDPRIALAQVCHGLQLWHGLYPCQ